MIGMNLGAYVDHLRPRTKKELREALALEAAEAQRHVLFDSTSLFEAGTFTVATLKPHVTHFIVGPDPYTDRRWYAQITIGHDGKVKFS